MGSPLFSLLVSILWYSCLFVYVFIHARDKELNHEQTVLTDIQNVRSID